MIVGLALKKSYMNSSFTFGEFETSSQPHVFSNKFNLFSLVKKCLPVKLRWSFQIDILTPVKKSRRHDIQFLWFYYFYVFPLCILNWSYPPSVVRLTYTPLVYRQQSRNEKQKRHCIREYSLRPTI